MYDMQQYGQQNIAGPGNWLIRRQQAQIAQQANQIVADAMLTSVRLSAAHYVTMTAMNHLASLAQQGYAIAGSDQYLASQLQALIGCYVGYARQQIWPDGPSY
ncbi:MAG: hypothetical protein ACR2N4_15990 [Jatrophihabitans sp.]